MNKWDEKIKNFILDSYDNPTKEEMGNFIFNREDRDETQRLGTALMFLELNGSVTYDDKHDCWLWIEPTEEMKEWMKECKPV